MLVSVSEMKPQWYCTDGIPYDRMWLDDKMWIPLMLRGAKFSGYFKFEGHDKILEHTLTEVDDVSCLKAQTKV